MKISLTPMRLTLLAIAFAISTRSAIGAVAKISSIGAPKRSTATAATQSLAPPDADALADQKQKNIGTHFRPTIELVAPVTAQAEPAVGPQAAVIGVDVQATGSAQFITNRGLTSAETKNQTSTVCEPSVAVRGKEILITGNWFAAFSRNAGQSFSYVSPYSTFPAVNGGFCCDQVAIYIPKLDLMCWFLQYIKDNTGNTARLAVAKGADITNQRWRYYDFTPQNVGNWQNEWFDYPDLAYSDSSLYITTNAFSISGGFTRTVALRLPLARLAAYQGFSYSYYDTNQVGSLRATQGASKTMYLAAHRNLSTLRVLTWPEGSNTIQLTDVGVRSWSDSTRVAPAPDGNDWLGRADGRITAASVTGQNIAFGWTAAQSGSRPFPYVRTAILNAATKQVVGQPDIWSSNLAFAYPAFASNAKGTLGVSTCYGGGAAGPSHGVGFYDAANSLWHVRGAASSGSLGPRENKWGDYLSIRQHGTDPCTWVATGFVLKGGTDRKNVDVRYVHFQEPGVNCPGREPDVDADGTDSDDRKELKRLKKELLNLKKELEQLIRKIDDLTAMTSPPATATVACCQ